MANCFVVFYQLHGKFVDCIIKFLFCMKCFYFFLIVFTFCQNLRFQIGDAAYLRMRLIQGRLRYLQPFVSLF